MSSRIGIWFDGGGSFGFGNICRSQEISKELLCRGHKVVNVALSKKANKLSPLPIEKRGQADVVILDVPYAGDEEVQRAHDFGAAVIALDYEGSVAPEAIISLHDIRNRPKDSKFYVGLEFAIIRSDLRAIKNNKTTNADVVVILGGGDSKELASEIVRKLPQVPVCLVQGPNAKPLKIKRKELRILLNPPDLPQLMSGCQWAVTSGGTTMLEMLHLGKAVHVVPKTEAERVFAKIFLREKALLGLGLENLRVPEANRIKSCERKGPSLIDGLGANRIVKIIEKFL